MKIMYVWIILTILGAASLKAQNLMVGQVTAMQQNGQIQLKMSVDVSQLALNHQQMATFTPILQAGNDTCRMAPVVITGRTRGKILQRQLSSGETTFETAPVYIVKWNKGIPQTIEWEEKLPFQEWMQDASLLIEEKITGCTDCGISNYTYPLLTPIAPMPARPQYELCYLTPPVEEIKQRNETYSARLNFEVGKYTLLHHYKNNAEILQQTEQVIQEILNDSNLTLTEFQVTGYASPEGNFHSNLLLSQNRALVFADYIKNRYPYLAQLPVSVHWKGEDWEGLYKEIESSSILRKQELLDILAITGTDLRKTRLHAINGGDTYRYLLKEYYPPLRRNDYTIVYVARPFDVEEARQLLKTKPQQLSLNEMFLVAHTYDPGSREFQEVFDIAARMFPSDPVAQFNAATLEINKGAYQSGIERLARLDMPEAWNNMGVAYAEIKEYEKAKDCFSKAAAHGVETAQSNTEKLEYYLNPDYK